jgi:dihydrofolate reductase
VISAGLLDRVRALKAEDGLSIWLCGGSTLAAALLPEIDTLFVKVSPVVLGRGLPLFAAEVPTRFAPTAVRTFTNVLTFSEYVRVE